MRKDTLFPDYIFESSWEVCNKVGGIYTVLSTRAKTLQDRLKDRVFFIGPDRNCWGKNGNPYFKEDNTLLASWQAKAKEEGLLVRVGRWLIPGEPIVILVDFTPFYSMKDEIYGHLWEDFKVDSLHGYGDYDEASMFSYAAGRVVESVWRNVIGRDSHVVYQGNEWMAGLGVLYIQKHAPEIGTIFTTHATSIGRSIAGNGKPLYQYFEAYDGDQMADELNMQSKQSIEKQTALNVDCFTTVSDLTAKECKQFFGRPVDVVLPNGFEDDFVPRGAAFTAKRKAARKRLLDVANALMGTSLGDDTLIVSTSGRYEFKNKGIDLFIESMNRLNYDKNLKKDVLACICVPAWVGDARIDLKERLASGKHYDTPLEKPMITHWLYNMGDDNALGLMNWLGINNAPDKRVKVMFIPCYLTGDDGIINMQYYDVILGNDLCVYPSYYEPWGYTPLEAVAFKVPCITSDLAGFGLWANTELGHNGELDDGVKVVHRTDYNYTDAADEIEQAVAAYSAKTKKDVDACRKAAFALSKKALWKKFIKYYEEAYDIALRKAESRK